MTKKATTGGQSLLINGALKMTRNKRAPSAATNQSNLTGAKPINISPNRHQQQPQELVLMNDSTREQLQAALESRHQQQHSQHHFNEGASTSSTESMSSFTGASSPLHEDHQVMIIKPGGANNAGGHHQAGPITSQPTNQPTFQSEQQQQHQHQQQQQQRQNLQSSTNGKNKKLFPQKLWDLINDERYSFCLRWSDDGQLVYLNRDEFEYSYLRTTENQFHTQKAISFVRQMNMYGFRKVDDSYYENDNFRRGCKHLLKNMTRKHPNKASGGLTIPNNAAAVANASMTINNRPELHNFTSYHKPIGGGAATLNHIASLFNGTVPANSKMAHQHHHQQQHQFHHHLSSIQSMPTESQQPVDLRRSIAPTGCGGIGATTTAVGNHLQSALAAAHNGQDLNRLFESLVAMSQANMFENSLRNQQQELMEQQQQRAQQANSEPMDLQQHVDIMNSPERTSHASMNESCSTAQSVSPTIDPANIHINFNPNTFMNLPPPTQQEQPLSLVTPASTTAMPANREQDIFNALHLVHLMLQFMAQNPNPN